MLIKALIQRSFKEWALMSALTQIKTRGGIKLTVTELTRDQLTELKQRYYTERNESVSYGELANIDELVTDAEIFEEYDYVNFVNDDFFCTAGKD